MESRGIFLHLFLPSFTLANCLTCAEDVSPNLYFSYPQPNFSTPTNLNADGNILS